ncbi:MAG: hypothetical protein PHQ27_08490 [Victivallales bacterium]|nr:hypothetical protein [Victivallales bacterium]
MNRRNFCRMLGLVGIATMCSRPGLMTGFAALVRVRLPRRYPGRVIPLDRADIAKPGRWFG